MWNQIFSRRTRPALVLASLVLIFLLALTIPSVRAAAINFLGLFRVQQIAVVEVNPANLPEQLGSSMSFEQLLAEDIQFGDPGESETVSSAAEAGALAGFQVRLPKAAQGEVQLRVQPGTQVTYNTEIERIQQILKEIGRSDIQLPDDLDNAAIVLDVPTSVLAGYGNCKLDHQEGEQGRMSSDPQSNCTILIQMPSPTISAPPGLDIPQIGEAFLQVMGMSAAEAERFSSRVDWATTLVIPVPRNGVDYADVQVDGVTGTLITQSRDVRAPNYMLLWVKGGQLYVLTGAGRPESGVEIADSLE